MKKFLLILFVVILFIAGVTGYFIFTSRGSAVLADAVISHVTDSDAQFGTVEGNLSNRIELKDVVIEHPSGLPEDSLLKIQQLTVEINSFGLNGLDIEVNNARLVLSPGDDPLVVNGSFREGQVSLDIFSSRLDLADILGLAAGKLKDKVVGVLSGVDLSARGQLTSLVLSGEVGLEEVRYQQFTLKECPLRIDLQLKNLMGQLKVEGAVTAEQGSVFGQRTAVVRLDQAKLLFSGDPKAFSLQCLGSSKVEKVEIKVDLRGTLAKPDLRLTSQPSLTQGRLLIMLATNRMWKGSEAIWDKKTLPADTIKDFIDYFVLSGSGSRLFQKYGITEFNVQFENGKKGVGVAKEISDNLEARYAVTQEQKPGEQPQTVQTIGGAVKLTDKISVEGQKEVRPRDQDSRLVDPAEQKEKGEVLLKYKTKF